MRLSATPTIKLKMQTAWDAGTLGYVKFKEFCDEVGEITEGKLTVQG
jgi:TRAP-type C4-dicarboxylate transport system substrate-binding protein